jgi:putative tryptophan/tyrosine transport system substrate-binding protein
MIATLASLPATAQRPYRVGMLLVGGPENADRRRFVAAFADGMKEHGYVEGRDYVLAVRHSGGDRAKLAQVAVELIAWPADVLIAGVSSTAAEVKKHTATIPIIMVTAVDAVGEGLVASLARPGGNVTGMTSFGPPMYGKLVELAHELLPRARRVAFMFNPRHALAPAYELIAAESAKALGLEVPRLPVNGASDLDDLPARLRTLHVDGLAIATDGLLYTHRTRILQAASSARIPSVGLLPELADAGAIATYGYDLANNYRALARFIDRIRKGAKPADLPVEQPTQFELVLNRKAAASLGVAIPPQLFARANRVIG